ncbi:hypothetical protein M422DRAFT_260578 [Sphaerobolus stellatus SS14]|uniref:Uncharacterized protein n=1 Tax=Sphaerobolus stellatus (strain SS14) TaxID=990650 RepID=A0A0C9UQJ2_SPHS4|nr:hypothetical protein M422DRAFT_260578 [Sphaerobolus stellatus SS14]
MHCSILFDVATSIKQSATTKLATWRRSPTVLDQEDDTGELNWVEAEVPQPDWELPTVIPIDAIGVMSEEKGNRKIPLYLNTTPTIMLPLNSNIAYPLLKDFVDSFVSILAEGSQISVGFACDPPDSIGLAPLWYPLKDVLPVVINGVTYNVDLAKNVASKDCCVYRFPTADCPKAFYGFASQKGSNVSASLTAQKPNSTPTSSAQCLQFSAPTGTPALKIPSTPQASIGYKGKYNVFGKENTLEVPLINAEELLGMNWPN